MIKVNNIRGLQFVERIMPLCLALFFCRTVFIGYKYLFFITLVPCIVYSVYVFFKQMIVGPNIKKLWLPLLVIAFYFVHFLPVSNVIKESVNILLIMYFMAFSKLYYADDKNVVLLIWVMRFTLLAGIIAIFKFALSFLSKISLPFSEFLFEGNGFSLVNDTNFYSLFFILALIISLRLFQYSQIRQSELFIVIAISLVNIVACFSRRAYALYMLFIVALVLFVCVKKRYEYKKDLLYNLLCLFVLIAVLIVTFVLSSSFYTPDISFDKKSRFYKIYSFYDKSISLSEFDIKRQRRYYEGKQLNVNLFYNGDFQDGMKYWRAEHTPPDSIVTTFHKDGSDAFIRIEKKNSIYGWSLRYMGRPIYYNPNIEYMYSFKYRVIRGDHDAPFRVGLWVKESNGYIDNLKKEKFPFDSIWNLCVVKHKFEKEQFNPTCFLNAQEPNSIIDIKDIRLTCDDTTGLPRYVDQLPDSVIHKYYSQDTINYFTESRTARLHYALELWQTRYNTQQKIFGQGFKYLEWYGERFWKNPDRHDFPHNPIISSFLYSGIIGGVVYIIFLIMSLWLYWKKRQQLGIFFIMYLCSMFFCMFSGSSHFSFPLFAFLSFLPFVEYKSEVNVP